MPFFSIVIPVYNRDKWIAASVNSVLQQSFNDYELIVINDGSTDNSEDVVMSITQGNSKVKYLYQENSERGAARNSGLRIASGTYAVFLDSDDEMHSDHLALLHKKIVEQGFPNFLTTKFFFKREDQTTIPEVIKSLQEGYCDLDFVLKGSHFGCNFVVKRSNPALHLFVEDRKYSIMEDWMFICQNLESDRLYIVDECTLTMNDHNERSMRGDNGDIIRKRLLASDWIKCNIRLSKFQERILFGFSYLFCSVHAYLDGKRADAFKFLSKSIIFSGIEKSKILLLIKIVVGYNFIHGLKK